MTHYNVTLNVKLSNSQLNKLKSGIKNNIEVTLNLSLSLTGNSNDETNFPHKLLLTDTQVSKIRKAFENGLSANIKLRGLYIIHLREFIFPDYIADLVPPSAMIKSVATSFKKKTKNTGTKYRHRY